MLNLTWIAPVVPKLPALKVLEELGRLGKITNVQIKTATGNILLDDVSNALDTRTDVLIWSGHGTANGLILSDESVIRAKWLALHVARSCQPRVAILAACGSQTRDAELNSFSATLCRSGVNVVGFPLAASDRSAGTFIVEGIRSLALGGTVLEAFEVALDAISDDATAKGVFLTPGMRNNSMSIENDLAAIAQRLAAIEALLRVGTQAVPDTLLSGDMLRNSDSMVTLRPMTRGLQQHIRGLTFQQAAEAD